MLEQAATIGVMAAIAAEYASAEAPAAANAALGCVLDVVSGVPMIDTCLKNLITSPRTLPLLGQKVNLGLGIAH